MFVQFSTFDPPGFALEIKSFNLYGQTEKGLLIDIQHMDGERERLTLKSVEYGEFSIGGEHCIMNVIVVPYPATPILSKEEVRARIGIGLIYDPKYGHFRDANAQ